MIWFWFLITLGCCGYFIVKKKLRYWEERGVPYIKPSLRLLADPQAYLKNAYVELKTRTTFGGLYLLTTPAVLVTDLDLVTNILVKDFKYFEDRLGYSNPANDVTSGGFFLASGQNWKTRRRNMGLLFTSNNLKRLHNQIVQSADEVLKNIGHINRKINLMDIAYKYIVQTSGKILFGTAFNMTKYQVEFRRFLLEVSNMQFQFNKFIIFGIFFPKLCKIVKMKVVTTKHAELITTYVNKTLEQKMKNSMEEIDLTNFILKNHDKEKIEDTAWKIFIYHITQHHIVKNTLAQALYELSLNQEIQDRARQEIRECLEKYDGKCTYEACMEMKYVNQIIHETLRKYQGVIVRCCTNDYEVSGTGHVIEKGTLVIIPVYAIHHDPEIYPEPEKFDPERFTKEAIQTRHPNAWLPFGVGPRFCIGKRLSMMQLTVGLVSFLSNYSIQISPKMNVKLDIQTFFSQKEIMLKFENIERM